MTALTRLRTYAALGPASIARVAAYRLGLRSGLHPVQRIAAAPPQGPFYRRPALRPGLPPGNESWSRALRRFGWHEEPLPDGPPDWSANPFGMRADAHSPWWRIGDFGGGDIKGVWELSRFDWLVAYATLAAHGDEAALARLNAWLADWSTSNPPYRGVNWKCGQEASIRVIHLLLAALLLGQAEDPEPGLVALIATHLRRIAPTMSYAIGQQNNHGTSEAAALFAGGDFLARAGDKRGGRWSALGRRWLEERATRLIEPDGSFSQYSVTYHRLMLDTYGFAKAWMLAHTCAAAGFSPRLAERLTAASRWLHAFVDQASGDAPNIGANDGARLLPLTVSDYRDFRPSLQLASALWLGARAIPEPGPWDDPLRWLGLDRPEALLAPPRSQSFDDGGYHLLRAGSAMACLRYPRFRFRPSQADALHLDLWARGRNLLRDAGTYSYNAADGSGDWFAGTAAHNTVAFDGRDQMPRLGRFLFGDWLKSADVGLAREDPAGAHAAAGYRDGCGAAHHRAITLRAEGLTCADRLSGRFKQAVLRWRLIPGAYRLDGNTLIGDDLSLAIAVEGAAPSLVLTSAPESRYYLRRDEVPVLEVRLEGPCQVATDVRF